MSREKVEALIADVVPRIEEIRDEALARVREVEADADEKIRRHGEARGELEGVEDEIRDLSAEREEIPARAYRAGLEGEYRLEDDLKERFQNLKPAIEASRERRDALREEISALVPPSPGRSAHELDAHTRHTSRVARAAAAEKEVTELLRKRLVEAANGAADAVLRAWQESRAEVQAMNSRREWEQSPVGQGAIQT